MIVSTVIAATVASANPQAAPAPADPHAGHKTMEHSGKMMACCEEMAKGEGCSCCKAKDEKASAEAKQSGHAR